MTYTFDVISAFSDGNGGSGGGGPLWWPSLVWTHVLADAAIAASYLAIVLAVLGPARRRGDLHRSGTGGLFATLVVACAAAHLLSVLLLLIGSQGFEAVLKIVAAISAVAIAILLWPLVSRAARPALPALAEGDGALAAAIASRDAALREMQAHIEQREQTERALLQSQKLEALGQLTGGIAHDFNNLLQAITGNLELIDIQPENSAGIARWSRNARQAVERGKKLTGQLLAFSRVQKLEIARFPLVPMLEETRDLVCKSVGPQYQVELAAAHKDLGVSADRNQLGLAILNLAINARDAMPDGGAIRIEAGTVSGKVHADLPAGDYAAISVRDSGIGMSAEVLSRAFEPFFSARPGGRGTGLGLSMVFGVVSQAGGAVEIDSAEGKGTTVQILLPRAFDVVPSDEQPATADAAGEAVLTGLNILVIDDDPDVLQTVAATLEARGATTVAAADGQAGLEAADAGGIDLTIVDFAMPGRDGAEVAARLRKAHPDRPVLIMTGFSESAKLNAVIEPGVGLLRKPFASDALLRAIGELLAGSEDRRQA